MNLKKFLRDEHLPPYFEAILGKASGNSFVVRYNPGFTFPLLDHRGKMLGEATIEPNEWAGKIFKRPRILKKPKNGRKKFLFGDAAYK